MPDCTNIKSVFIHRPKLKAEYFPNLNLRSKQTSLYSLPSERHIFSSPVIPVSQPHDQCVHWGSDSSELCWESMSWSSFSKTNCRAESAPRASDTDYNFSFQKRLRLSRPLTQTPHRRPTMLIFPPVWLTRNPSRKWFTMVTRLLWKPRLACEKPLSTHASWLTCGNRTIGVKTDRLSDLFVPENKIPEKCPRDATTAADGKMCIQIFGVRNQIKHLMCNVLVRWNSHQNWIFCSPVWHQDLFCFYFRAHVLFISNK